MPLFDINVKMESSASSLPPTEISYTTSKEDQQQYRQEHGHGGENSNQLANGGSKTGGNGSCPLTSGSNPGMNGGASPLFALPSSVTTQQAQPRQPALFSISSSGSSSSPKPPPKQQKKMDKTLFDISCTNTKNPLFALPPNSSTQQPPPESGVGNNNNKKSLFDIEQGGQGTLLQESKVETTYSLSQTGCVTASSDQTDDVANVRQASESAKPPSRPPSSVLPDDDDDNHSDAGVSVSIEKDDNDSMGSSSVGSLVEKLRSRTGLMVSLIVVLGVGAAAAFLAIGVTGAQREQRDQFQRTAMDLMTAIESQFDRYVTAANYVHHYCRNRSFTRRDFLNLYEYLVEDGLDFKAVQFDPNVTREERPRYEEEARQYYAEHYPHINYRGFVGFDDGVKNGLVPTSERDFYFPIHYMEPIIGNEAAIDLDYYSHISRRRTLSHAFEYGEPAITDRLLLVKDPNVKSRCGSQDAASYGIVLMHPGVNISDPRAGVWPRDLSSIVVCIPGLLVTATDDLHVASQVYIHDAADSSGNVLFLGGVAIDSNGDLSFIDEIELADIHGDMKYQEDLVLTNKVWTITVVATNDTYKPNLAFVILGGVLVLLASVCLGLWVHNNTRRTHKFNAMKAKVEGEKAALILENTRQAARAERELNDFIAHEVRNPVAAAMAACSFVKSAVNEKEPLVDPQKREDTREDVGVIYNSLQFINDLLRNMLDMHRASHKQLQVNLEPIDLYHDILQSTAGMIYQRDSKVKVIVECEPQNLHVRSDCLRLKQVILNLSRNATKFVNEGFIKLKGYVVDNEVCLAVEDSGIGIPAEKRDLLFAKFQESLDQLSQGTGIGLYLCKNLVELMGGDIYLDKAYDSGIPGNPGTSIIINLRRPPLTAEELANGLDGEDDISGTADFTSPTSPLDNSQASQDALLEQALPEHLNVLFVDDDAILRKLFARSVKRVAPGWTMREASNGESALQLLDEGLQFDLIFVDQYMASIEKQLLGTETILEMRARGCESRLFGLSANDLEAEFIAAGADGFVIKPFPTETDALKLELLRAYYGKRAYYAKR